MKKRRTLSRLMAKPMSADQQRLTLAGAAAKLDLAAAQDWVDTKCGGTAYDD